jgi:elongation factor G
MADTRRDTGTGPAPLPTSASALRNVALVGPPGSGKTTLMESLLATAGAISRRGSIADGSTVGDRDPVSHRQRRSVEVSIATFAWSDATITLLDTPGYPDYTGDLRAGLRGADSALFVVSSTDGIDAATARLWEECEVIGMPRAIVVTNLDRERADFDETVAVCQRLFTGNVLPLFLPIHADNGGVIGFIDLLDEQIWHWSTGDLTVVPAEDRHVELIESERSALIEAVVTESEDELLMDTFISGEHVDVGLLTIDLERAVARGHFHPVVGHAETGTGIGAQLILDLIVRAFPSPSEHPIPVVTSIDGSPIEPIEPHADGPLVAEVIKTSSDPYVGKISIVRVFSGTLLPDSAIHVSGHFSPGTGHEDHDVDERIGHLMTLLGAQHRDVERAGPGSIVAAGRLTRAETGDTLSSPERPLLMEPWAMPEPLLPVAIVPRSSSDDEKLVVALTRVASEDPTLRIARADDTGQIVVWTLGEAHADLVVERIRSRYGVEVESVDVRSAVQATLTSGAAGSGRLVKQSGGHGQYAVVQIEVEPLPSGSGLEFVDRVVGGAVPRNFIPAVEKGVRAQMEAGTAAGIPLVDLRVTLVDGKAHSVDSSDMAFQTAGAMALKDAVAKADVILLEPIVTLTIDVPDEHVGAVMSDLSTRRAIIRGTDSDGGGRTIVVADAPESEVSRYAIDIRSVSHGSGSFSREATGYAPMPANVARRLLEEQ